MVAPNTLQEPIDHTVGSVPADARVSAAHPTTSENNGPIRSDPRNSLRFALITFLAVVAGWYYLCLQQTGGVFVYPLDDAYIHLAIARTIADYGVWGPTPEAFASTASSLAWPLQLAALMKLFGPQEWLPLALNLCWGILALLLAHQIFHSAGTSSRLTFWALLLLIFIPSLPLLVFLGMEHVMQATVALAFAWYGARALSADSLDRRQQVLFWLLAGAVTMTRYEGMFLVLAVVCAALLQRRWREAVTLPIAAVAPIAVFGIYAVSQGSHFLPNPIIVKSDLRSVHSVADFILLMTTIKLGSFVTTTAVLLPVLAALIGLVVDAHSDNRLGSAERLFILIVVLTAVFHLFGARTGWFTRYEAYLVFLAIVACVLAWRFQFDRLGSSPKEIDDRGDVITGLCTFVLCLVLAAPFYHRMVMGLFRVPTASKNIHDQQIQMARFVKKYYDGQPLVLNDLGAIAWHTRAKPIDMAGLATLEVAEALAQREYTSDLLTELARKKGARIAVVYNTPLWMPEPRPPEGWQEVGVWSIGNNVVCGEPSVYFYALDEAAAETLTANLRDFADSLPKDVAQSGAYVSGSNPFAAVDHP